MKNKLIFKDISLAGIFLGFVWLLNILSSFFPIFFGYSLNIYIVFFTIGLIIFKNYYIKIIFFTIAPFILIMTPNIYFINITQFFIEYWLGVWCFFPFLFGKCILKKNRNSKIRNIYFSILFILCWILKLIIHTIAGFFWWTNNDWVSSLLINLPIIISNVSITIPVFIIIFNITIKCSETYYLNIWNN